MVAGGRRLGRRLPRRRCASGRCGHGRSRATSPRRSPHRRPRRPSRWRRSSPISKQTIVPGMTHWQHPRFFAYFPANAAPVSVVAEYLVTRDGGAMHALADLAGRDRARDAHDRLAAPGARPARRLFRRHPGFGLVGDAGRRADHARARARLAGQPAGPVRAAAGCASIAPTRSTPRSTAPSGSPASARTISCAFRPAAAARHGCRRAGSGDRRRPGGRPAAGRHHRLRRRHQRRRHRRRRRRRRGRQAARALSACRCRLGRLGDDLPGIPAFLGGRRRRRIRSSSTRTNGWARSSTARCSSSASRRAWCARWRSSRNI